MCWVSVVMLKERGQTVATIPSQMMRHHCRLRIPHTGTADLTTLEASGSSVELNTKWLYK